MHFQNFIHLECPDTTCKFSPNAIGYIIKQEDYIPGKIKCNKCGRILIPPNDPTDDMLFELRISKQ